MLVAIQGIPGSFHHQVALNNFGENVSISGYRTFEEVAKSISNGDAHYGVMAIENSIAGAILPNYELIDRYGLYIFAEYYLPISHNLMCLPGQSISDIQVVRSHPMALLQCKKFFARHHQIRLEDDVDTATVARKIADENLKGVAAIASKTARQIYGLSFLAEDIQTVRHNFTRFILLQKEQHQPDFVPNKASIKVTIQNVKGSLANLLILMSEHGMDLSKIQSIPVIERPWNYAFFIDAIFDDYALYQQAIQRIRQEGSDVIIFGEYKNGK